jgi:hypothetical protein
MIRDSSDARDDSLGSRPVSDADLATEHLLEARLRPLSACYVRTGPLIPLDLLPSTVSTCSSNTYCPETLL